MDFLEQIHLDNPKKFYLQERKLKINAKNSILCGPNRCGKTSIVLNYLFESRREEYLYIDYDDIRIPNDLPLDHILEFCTSKNIRRIGIENPPFNPKSIENFEVIISSKSKINTNDFARHTLLPLDFEEFISFSQKQLDEPNHIFSLFLKEGNLPEKVGKSDFAKLKITQQAILTISQVIQKQNIFLFLCQNATNKLTFLQIYNSLKANFKTSKDSIYRYANELEDEGAIYFVEKFGQLNGAKKIYLYDFSMIEAVTLKKELHKIFENMIFLELAKHNQDIYYDDGIDFLIPEASRAVISRAFGTVEKIMSKLPKMHRKLRYFEIELLEVVTMGSEFLFQYDGITIEALPFWTWALKD